ncbi:MAG: holo-ACP synthase [Candidatus Pristimantibacillus lignocellulolyticus]|uniref:Holo-[acyl-carrier-protein] synthase n=1 Tax=Candidatus Pristimantibacillus lignocellulolyticus TaxID=2994561 RepID=A0A9J6ZFG2_9BACL|nr:MAG: holo-ACP synthase [Candidatus Pristimantibacillus lignocellulolyticus]
MIIGIGHDMTELSRLRKILTGELSEKFLRRIFTELEFEELGNTVGELRKVEYVAGRFAVKEAVSKAFGCGIGSKLSFHDIQVMRSSNGKPTCTVSSTAIEALGYLNMNLEIHVSITHERELASAFVVVEHRL